MNYIETILQAAGAIATLATILSALLRPFYPRFAAIIATIGYDLVSANRRIDRYNGDAPGPK